MHSGEAGGGVAGDAIEPRERCRRSLRRLGRVFRPFGGRAASGEGVSSLPPSCGTWTDRFERDVSAAAANDDEKASGRLAAGARWFRGVDCSELSTVGEAEASLTMIKGAGGGGRTLTGWCASAGSTSGSGGAVSSSSFCCSSFLTDATEASRAKKSVISIELLAPSDDACEIDAFRCCCSSKSDGFSNRNGTGSGGAPTPAFAGFSFTASTGFGSVRSSSSNIAAIPSSLLSRLVPVSRLADLVVGSG
ncbi:hypothetical protein BDZ88DRAFT_402380 [Geranomyces variabilis]|nr:hypothetical protein BDZ88DRAFT_402380 [Geranomyces variabilis]